MAQAQPSQRCAHGHNLCALLLESPGRSSWASSDNQLGQEGGKALGDASAQPRVAGLALLNDSCPQTRGGGRRLCNWFAYLLTVLNPSFQFFWRTLGQMAPICAKQLSSGFLFSCILCSTRITSCLLIIWSKIHIVMREKDICPILNFKLSSKLSAIYQVEMDIMGHATTKTVSIILI